MARSVFAYLWGFLGKLGPQIISLATMFVLARFLSPDDFGQIAVLTIFTAVAQTLFEAGLGGSLVKEKNPTPIDFSTIFVFNISVSAFLYIVIFLCAPLIEDYFQLPGLATICRLLSLAFVINSWGLVAFTVLYRELKFKTLTYSSLISFIVGGATGIATAVWLEWGVYSLVAYQLTQNLVYVGRNWFVCRYRCSFRFSAASFRKLFSFGFFTTVANVVETAYEHVITIFFGRYLGISQAGLLSQAQRIQTASVSSFTGTVNAVAFPLLTPLRDDAAAFRSEADKLLRTLSLSVLPLLMTIALFAEFLMVFLFGEQWRESAPYLRILMWVGCFFVLESANRTFIKSLARVHALLGVTLIKRALGLLLMGVAIMIDRDWLLYAFLGGSIIGYLANAVVYVRITSLPLLPYLGKTLFYLLIPSLLYLAGVAINHCVSSTLIQLPVWTALLAAYYLLLLPRLGIRLLALLRKN